LTTLKQQIILHYEKQGYLVADVERRGWKGKTRHDLWGIADLLAIRPELGMGGHPAQRLLIQVCGREDRRPHWKKLLTGQAQEGVKADKQIPVRLDKCLRAGFRVALVTASQEHRPLVEYITREHLINPTGTLERLRTLRQIEAQKKRATT